ncbi:hypothetical protein [Neobacillus sp. PS2-9]|uniref:hypothetical protein n=1 Tax=Neobacillus sp. PS2-9 TaxID=3070676 RepID=UPI0027E02606|nr:hypothetical protein [Neobacillus sp. PS2-9]WML57725.1 hypothetical protein RCG25_22940 [Neobacillus sp. PS2-9]
MKGSVSTVFKGLLLLSIWFSIFGISAFDGRAILEGFAHSFFEAKKSRELIYVTTMPLLLVVGLIIEFIIYSRKKKIFDSFVYSGYLSLVVIVGMSYWLLLSLEDGLAFIGILGMSMAAFAVISIVQLVILFFYRFIQSQ